MHFKNESWPSCYHSTFSVLIAVANLYHIIYGNRCALCMYISAWNVLSLDGTKQKEMINLSKKLGRFLINRMKTFRIKFVS